MTRITELPTETLWEVVFYVDPQDNMALAYLALTCRRLCNIYMPQVLDDQAVQLEKASFLRNIRISPPIEHQISSGPKRNLFDRSYNKIEVYVERMSLGEMRCVRCLICRAREIRDVELFVAESSKDSLRSAVEVIGTCIGRPDLRLRVTTAPRASGITVRLFKPNVVPSQITASTEPTTAIHVTSSMQFTTSVRVPTLPPMQTPDAAAQSTHTTQSTSTQAISNVIEASTTAIATRRNSRLWSFPIPSMFRRRTTPSIHPPSSPSVSTATLSSYISPHTSASNSLISTGTSSVDPPLSSSMPSLPPSTPSPNYIPIEIRDNASGVTTTGHTSDIFYSGIQNEPIFSSVSFLRPLLSSLFIDGQIPFHKIIYPVTRNALNSGITSLSLHRMPILPDEWNQILPTIALPALKSLTIGGLSIAFHDLMTFLQRHNSIKTLVLIDNQPVGGAADLSSYPILPKLITLTANSEYILPFLQHMKLGNFPSFRRLCIVRHTDGSTDLSTHPVYDLLSNDDFGDLVVVLDGLGASGLIDWLLRSDIFAEQRSGASDRLSGIKTLILNSDDFSISTELTKELKKWINYSRYVGRATRDRRPTLKISDTKAIIETLIWAKCGKLEALKIGRKMRTRTSDL